MSTILRIFSFLIPTAHYTMTVDTPTKFPARAHAAKVVAELVQLIPEAERAGVSGVALGRRQWRELMADSRRVRAGPPDELPR